MIEIKTNMVISRPFEEIFEFMADFDSDVYWRREVLESKQIYKSEPGVGATCWQKSQIMG